MKKKNLKQVVFLICYAILLADITLRYAEGVSDVTHFALNFIAMPLLVLLIIDNLNGLSLKRALAVLGVVAVGVATRLIANDNTLMLSCLFICAFKGMELDDVVKMSIPLRIILLTILLALFNLGLTKATEYTRNDGVVRYAYGFGNLNNLSTYILSTILQILYLDRKRIGWRDLAVVLASFIIIAVVTASRTHEAILLISAIFIIYTIFRSKAREKKQILIKSKVLKFFCKYSFLIMLLISAAVYLLYKDGNSFADSINSLTSSRVSTVKRLIDVNGISLFGQNVNRITTLGTRRALDNSYAYILLYYGPVVLVAVALYSKKCIKNLLEHKDDALALLLTVYNIAGLAERFAIEVSTNTFLLGFSKLIYGNEEKCQKKN